MPYEVYVNHPRNKAIVHDSTCAYLRMHGGVSTTNPPTGHYSCVLQDLDAAWAFAFAANKWETRTCMECLGWLTPPEEFPE